jgi:hypothetical protein
MRPREATILAFKVLAAGPVVMSLSLGGTTDVEKSDEDP